MNPKIFKYQRLTKKFLFSLEEGLFISTNRLMGNVVYQTEAICEFVSPMPEREEQWERIKAERANGCMCAVFKDRGDYCMWFEDFLKANLFRKNCRIKEDIPGLPLWTF